MATANQQPSLSNPCPPIQECGGVSKGNLQDRKDLERFAKFFTIKCVQVIVQSRLGEKIRSCSKPLSTGADWFNLTIQDNEEVLQESKRAISGTSLPGQPPLFVEISLKTPEDTLILEIWSLSFKQELQEPNIRILYTVYNRMALLLKSIISVTRVIPAYKLSRMKTSDYVMCYNIYTAEQHCNNMEDVLGHGYNHVELGTVGTPFGGLVFELSYRTRLEIIVPVNKTMMIKSDHYGNSGTGAKEIQAQNQGTNSPEASPLPKSDQLQNDKHPRHPHNDGIGNGTAVTKPQIVVGAFEPVGTVSTIDDDDDASIPFSNLLKQSMKFKKIQNQNISNNPPSPSNTNTQREEPIIEVPEVVPEVKLDSQTSDSSSSGAGDRNPPDFIMVDLKTPFAPSPAPSTGTGASGNTSGTDPINFFNQVKDAPINLTSLESNLPGQIPLDFDIELNSFEQSIGEYDDFVNKLCGSGSQPDFEGSSSSGSGPRIIP